MKVGLMADTHDDFYHIRRAVEEFNLGGVDLVLHAGDFNSPSTAPCFSLLNANMIAVYGNNDIKRRELEEAYLDVNCEFQGCFADIKLDGCRVAMIHGLRYKILRSLMEDGIYDLVVHGHTHRKKVKMVNRTLVVNPGAVSYN
jgi:hypothetical protein